MKRIVAVLFPAILFAADPAGFVKWSAKDLKGYEQKLQPKMDAQKVATEQLGTWGNHSAMIAHREGDGQAELHENVADVFMVQSGEATLVVGGTVANGKTTAPHEIRGPKINGGAQHKLAAGDVVHIPANVPHQLLVAKGTQFTYFVVKIQK
jgi:mannose-6-phosphate isomerase-like protein (cupin superfamily)